MTAKANVGTVSDLCAQDRIMLKAGMADELPYLNLELIETQTGVILGTSDEVPKSTTFQFDDGHVLYGKLRPYLNKVSLPGFRGRCSTEMVPLRPRRDVDREYLAYFLRSTSVVNAVTEKSTGARMPRTDMEFLLSLPAPIRPHSEQRRIVDILNHADSIRRLRRQAEQKAREIIPALFVEMFGDPVTNPRGWEVRHIGDIGEVQGGLQVTKKREPNPIEVPYLRVANVFRDEMDLREIKTIRVTEKELARVCLENGDVLIVEGHGNPGEIGRCAVWKGSITPCVHQNHLIRVRCTQTAADPIFMSSYLNSSVGRQHLLKSGKTTSGLNTISTANVKATPVIVPPVGVQREFSHRVAEVRALATQQSGMAETAETTMQALMARYFNA